MVNTSGTKHDKTALKITKGPIYDIFSQNFMNLAHRRLKWDFLSHVVSGSNA